MFISDCELSLPLCSVVSCLSECNCVKGFVFLLFIMRNTNHGWLLIWSTINSSFEVCACACTWMLFMCVICGVFAQNFVDELKEWTNALSLSLSLSHWFVSIDANRFRWFSGLLCSVTSIEIVTSIIFVQWFPAGVTIIQVIVSDGARLVCESILKQTDVHYI